MVFIVAVVAPRTFSAMSLDHHHSFPALNDSNWDSWYIRMQAHLIRKGLWFNIIKVDSDPLEGTTDVVEWHEKQMKKRKKSKMEEARAEIVLKVEDPQLVHMRSRDPYEIMEALKRVHVARGLGTRMSLRRRFWNMEKKEDESMANWVSRVKALVWKLEAIGVEVTEEDTILALTNGLDDSFESFIISLDSTPPDQLSLQFTVDRMVNEEARRGDKVSGSVSAHAYLVKGKQQGKSSRVCWRCGKPGHIKNFCTEEEVPEQGKSGNGSSVGGQANLVLGGGGHISDLVDLGAREIGHVL